MQLVIGMSGKAAPGALVSVAFHKPSALIGLSDLAPTGLPVSKDSISAMDLSDAKARFDGAGEHAIALLGEYRSWPLVETFVQDAGAAGLFIFDDAAAYIAARLGDGSDLETAAIDWSRASSRLLEAADRCNGGVRLVSGADIAAAPEAFTYFCETEFGVVLEARAKTPPALDFVIASHFISTRDELLSLSEELTARSQPLGTSDNRRADTAEEALAWVAYLNDQAERADRLSVFSAQLKEQLHLAQYKAETYFKSAKEGGGSAKGGASSAALKAELEHARHEINALKQSTSWKVSVPVRIASRGLKRLGGLRRVLSERRHLTLLRQSDLFDADWYRQNYPDVAEARLDPALHFLRFGANEGRSPSPKFSCAKYLKSNPDVSAAGTNPLVHYLQFGRAEGRATGA